MDRRRVVANVLRLALVAVLTCSVLTIASRFQARSEDTNLDHLNSPSDAWSGKAATQASSTIFDVASEITAFLGKRPDARTVANATAIARACKGVDKNGWKNTRACVDYLRYRQDEYHSIDALSEDTKCDFKRPLKYHTYWRGLPTTRVSFMLKSFLYTQNLECSQLHIWLDADHNPTVVDDAMDSTFMEPFLPLISRGLIVLRTWHYPRKVYIPEQHQIDEFGTDNMLSFEVHQIPSKSVAVSDSVRFIVLHEEGGFYADMDTMFLRDLRPLLIAQNLSFAERWAAHPGAGEYNTAYLRLSPHSSLSSHILQGAAKMGLNFHPRVIGRMLAKTGLGDDLLMFETGVFDPLWSEFDRARIGSCCTPCLTDFEQFYQRQRVVDEWIALDPADIVPKSPSQGNVEMVQSNRTLSNFYVGAYTHHIHNQWASQVAVGSWIWVADQTYNQFLQGGRKNPYGESWRMPQIKFPADEALYRP